jgi:hypothetical protein
VPQVYVRAHTRPSKAVPDQRHPRGDCSASTVNETCLIDRERVGERKRNEMICALHAKGVSEATIAGLFRVSEEEVSEIVRIGS